MKQKSRSDIGSDIVARIKAMIFSGELLPGQQIRQEEFAQQFGISRTPLLHALQVLKSEMLVESYPNRGTFVRTISPRMVMLGNVLLVTYQKGLIRPPVETLPEHLAIIEALSP